MKRALQLFFCFVIILFVKVNSKLYSTMVHHTKNFKKFVS